MNFLEDIFGHAAQGYVSARQMRSYSQKVTAASFSSCFAVSRPSSVSSRVTADSTSLAAT